MEEAGKEYIPSQTINPLVNKDEVDVIRDALTLELSDDKFLEYAKRLKRESDEFWMDAGKTGYNLPKRREENEKYLFGRQYSGLQRKKAYASTAQDNILYEAQAYLKAMAFSKLPDITVTPGDDSDEKKEIAKLLSKVLTPDKRSKEYRDRKRVMALAFKHLPVYYVGAIKRFWNPQKGKFGDMDAKVVFPGNLTFDFRATSNDVRDMDYIFETCENTVKELVMRFPDKKEDFYKELYKWGVFQNGIDENGNAYPNENNEAGMNSKVKYIEVWFKWYDHPKENPEEWEEIIGVAWYFQGVLFKKMRHPYWDWTGTPQTFTYELEEIAPNKFRRKKKPATTQQMKDLVAGNDTGANLQTETVFHNHLDYPEFPYIFMNMDQWGKMPIDETTPIEQARSLQETYDKRNRELDEIIDRSRGKAVFSSSEGITKDDVANIDTADPYQKILIRGDINKMFKWLPGEQPSPAIFQSALDNRERIFDKLGVHQATRGQINSETAATNSQISREGDFTRMDDLVDDTINYASEKWANWDMQFIKLFYTEEHLKRILGPDGSWLTVKIHRDDISDGMEVIISASGSDKLKAEQRAIDNAKMKLIDPYHYFVDTGESDPRGRTVSLMNFLMNPQGYLMDIEDGGDGTTQGVLQAAQAVNGASGQPGPGGQQPQGQPQGQPQQGGQGGDPQALQDIMQIEQGQVPPPPTQLSQGYMQTFTAFMNSPEIEQLIAKYGPQFKAQLLQFAKAVSQMAHQPQQQAPQQTPGVHPAVQAVGGTGPAEGPLAQNPSPQNTSKVAAIAQRPGM